MFESMSAASLVWSQPFSSKLWEKNRMIAILQYKSWMLYPSFAAALFQISKF